MKPYGQKHNKSLLNTHPADYCSTCSNDEWKIIKGRERKNNEEIDDFLYSDEMTASDELEATIRVYAEEDELFRSCSNLFEEQAVAIDPDEAMEKLLNKIYKQNL
jgi:citrate lyase synthetase